MAKKTNVVVKKNVIWALVDVATGEVVSTYAVRAGARQDKRAITESSEVRVKIAKFSLSGFVR